MGENWVQINPEMTTHEMAKQLLALPDVPLVIEGLVTMTWSHETVAEMTGYDPEGTAIIWQKPIKPTWTPKPTPPSSSS